MGKIKLCMPFFNEDLVAKINVTEASKWVDEIHVTEFDKSFKCSTHQPSFKLSSFDRVHYHLMNADGHYLAPRKYVPHIFLHPISRWMKKYCLDTAWYNEGVSRNFSLWNSNYADDDIIILSDIDEIIDSRYAEEILNAVEKYNAITIKVHFTNFYFNLYCPKWSGPEGYSYRVFAIKGKYLKDKYKNDSDWIRKLGENGQLRNELKCLDGFKGFHHSWLGNVDFVKNKLESYAHSLDCHDKTILNTDGTINFDVLRKHIVKGKSIFGNTQLVKDDSIRLLPQVEEMRLTNPELFFD